MSNSLGKIATTKIPASQAIPGNAEHAKIIQRTNLDSGEGGLDSGDGGNSAHNWAQNVRTGVQGPALIGLTVLGLFALIFGFWAASAPLSGAAIAPGVITASGQNLRIQHLEGGIIEQILVAEGDRVSKNQPLLTLDPTDAKATRDRLTKSLIALNARDERLQAERDGVPMAFSPQLVTAARG